jgi:hypothetical protein
MRPTILIEDRGALLFISYTLLWMAWDLTNSSNSPCPIDVARPCRLYIHMSISEECHQREALHTGDCNYQLGSNCADFDTGRPGDTFRPLGKDWAQLSLQCFSGTGTDGAGEFLVFHSGCDGSRCKTSHHLIIRSSCNSTPSRKEREMTVSGTPSSERLCACLTPRIRRATISYPRGRRSKSPTKESRMSLLFGAYWSLSSCRVYRRRISVRATILTSCTIWYSISWREQHTWSGSWFPLCRDRRR